MLSDRKNMITFSILGFSLISAAIILGSFFNLKNNYFSREILYDKLPQVLIKQI